MLATDYLNADNNESFRHQGMKYRLKREFYRLAEGCCLGIEIFNDWSLDLLCRQSIIELYKRIEVGLYRQTEASICR